ncbi:hypothetical protein Hanom_Chr08g00696541 [Helianthus anomalus]
MVVMKAGSRYCVNVCFDCVTFSLYGSRKQQRPTFRHKWKIEIQKFMLCG